MTSTATRLTSPPELDLLYPRTLGVYDSYQQAQRVVDHLADHEFPVQDVAIVGTDLRSVERVTGRPTRATAALAGTVSGLWLGLFVGAAFALLSPRGQVGSLVTALLLGGALGLVRSQLGFAAATRGGRRSYSSVSRLAATRYEVLVEHRVADRARELLAAATALT